MTGLIIPGEFDSWLYNRCRGIDYTLYPDSYKVIEEGGGVKTVLYKIRQSLYEAIDEVSEGDGEAGLFKAILFGDKSEIDDDTYASFQICGIAHILAVGGLHLTILGMAVLKFLKKLGASKFVASIISDAFLLLFVIMTSGSISAWRAYIVFTIMLAAPLIGRTYDALSALGLAGIVILITQPLYALDCAFQLSFAAAFGIGAIMPRLKNIAEELRPRDETGQRKELGFIYYRIITPLIFSFSIQVMTIPVMLYNFYAISVYGIILNLIIIPVMSVLVISLFSSAIIASLGGAFSTSQGGAFSTSQGNVEILVTVGRFFAGLAHYFFKSLIWICELVQKLPGASIVLGRPAQWKIIFYYAVVALVLIMLERPVKEFIRNKLLHVKTAVTRGSASLANYEIPVRRVSRRFFAVLLIVPALALMAPSRLVLAPAEIFSSLFTTANSGSLTLTALYVGQGDCTVIMLPNGHAIIFDAGSSSKKNVAKSVIIPYLKSCAITEVDMIVLSHPDIDHTNGVVKIVEDYYVNVGGVAAPLASAGNSGWDEVRAACEQAAVPFYYINAGDEIAFSSGEIVLSAISPKVASSAGDNTLTTSSLNTSTSKNDGSLVVRLSYGTFSALFTGDISSDEERSVIKSGGNLSATYLKCPHHGSKYSSCDEFLLAVSPLVTTVSAGRGNSYGHPTKAALERIAAAGSNSYITKSQGAITTKVTPSGQITVKTWR